MKVTIVYNNAFNGGDGTVYYPVSIEISDYCPECGAKRGQPEVVSHWEKDDWFVTHRWHNPCGHLDKHKDCYFESLTPPIKIDGENFPYVSIS